LLTPPSPLPRDVTNAEDNPPDAAGQEPEEQVKQYLHFSSFLT
jgi:hypothetical protein